MAARLVDELAERLLGVAVIGDELAIAFRFLDRVEVLALDVLEQGDLERLGIGKIAHDHRHFVESRLLGRAPAPLAGDDLVAMAVRPDQDRLEHAARLDRGGELVERLLVEMAARLVEMRLDAGHRHQLDPAARRGSVERRLLRDFAEQGGEAAAEPRRASAGGGVVAHAATARCGIRPISSRASAI